MNHLFTTFLIYITIFLFGMTVMKIGLGNVAKQRLKDVLYRLTDSPLKGLLIGTLATAVLQSSSAVTVLAVGMVAAGLIKFHQTIGIILGANIGTTATGLIAAYPVGDMKFVLLGIGVALLFLPYEKMFALGAMCFGLGCLFTAMDGFNALAEPLKNLASVQAIFEIANASMGMSVLFGAAFTGLIQSSSATTLIVMGFINHGALSLVSSVAIVLGANVGTCTTALIACIGSSRAARWTAYTHGAFNFLGVLLFFPFLRSFTLLISHLAATADLNLAYASILFNVITALVALPFATRYGKWAERKLRV